MEYIRNIGTKDIRIPIFFLIFILSVDTVINQLGGAMGLPLQSSDGIPLFIAISSATIICHIFVLQFVSNRSQEVRRKSRQLAIMHNAVIISQYFIIAIFIIVMLQILFSQSYSALSSILVSMISYILSTTLMGIFTVIFLSWYKNKNSSILVLIYALSFVTVVIAAVAVILIWGFLFSDKIFTTIYPDSDSSFPKTEAGSIWKTLAKIYQYSDTASFLLKWGGTAIILYHYSSKFGKVKYWFLLSLPLIYYSTVIIYHSHLYDFENDFEASIFLGFTSINSTFGGILFYLAFRLTSRSYENNKVFRDYLIMTGYGFMLFFSGTHGSLVNTAYPPFGFATVSTYGLGTYLILLGLYLSALSISQNEQLKEMIRKSTLAESKFLHSIGTSAGERKKILLKSALIKSRIEKEKEMLEVGIGAPLSEEDIKEFVQEIDDKEVK